MDTTIVLIGVVSGVLGVIDFFLSRGFKKLWWVHVIYVVLICFLGGTAIYKTGEIARINNVTRSADALVGQRNDYTHRGYVFAVLAFLEKNKDLLPDTYLRAQAACSAFRCNQPGTDVDMVELSFALNGIVRGVGTIEGGH